MLEQLIVLLPAFLYGIEDIINRHILIREDAIAYAFIWQVMMAIFFIPFMFFDQNWPTAPFAWGIVIISSLLWATATILIFTVLSKLEISIKSPIYKSRVLFFMILSVIFLQESLTIGKIIGTLLIFAGITLLVLKNHNLQTTLKSPETKHNTKSILLLLIAAILTSFAMICDKIATTNDFDPAQYVFLVSALPALFTLPFVLRKKTEIQSLITNNSYALFGSAFISGLSYVLMLYAFRAYDANVVIPISELGTIVTVIGGIVILKEYKNMVLKLLVTIIIIAGAILVLIS